MLANAAPDAVCIASAVVMEVEWREGEGGEEGTQRGRERDRTKGREDGSI